MGDVVWTMVLLAGPLLLLGRDGLTRWQRGLSDGALKGLAVWGWVSGIFLLLMLLGSDGVNVLGKPGALYFAACFLCWLAAAGESARRKRGGTREKRSGERRSKAAPSPTPDRPLSFMRQLEEQERTLLEQAAVAAPVPTPVPPEPAPVVRYVEAAPVSSAPVSVFAVPAGGQAIAAYAAPQAALPAPAQDRVYAAPPLPQQSAMGEAPRQPTRLRSSGGKRGQQAAERGAAQARLLGTLQAYLGDLQFGDSPAPAASAAPDAAPLSQSQPPAATSSFGSSPPYTPPSPPAPSGPVTLGSGFSYKPQLIESRLGQPPQTQNGSS